MGIRMCPKCNGKVSTSRNVCIHCGYIFPSSKKCPDCGEAVDISVIECPVCGYLFNKASSVNETSNDVKKAVIAVQKKTNVPEPEIVVATNEISTETEENNLEIEKEILVKKHNETKEVVGEETIVNDNKIIALVDDAIQSIVAEETEEENNKLSVECPYCGSKSLMPIGIEYYMCDTCKGRFLYTSGVGFTLPYVRPSKLSEAIEVSKNVTESSISKNAIEESHTDLEVQLEESIKDTIDTTSVFSQMSKDDEEYSEKSKVKKQKEKSSSSSGSNKKIWIIIASGVASSAVIFGILAVIFVPNLEKNNKLYFGTYPQTEVTATSENGLSSITFDSSTWISYRYYISSSQSDYMYYRDVDIDNNGTYDYRGVYLTSFRSYYYSSSSSTSNNYQDDNGYTTGTIYWFSYDPIEWDILTKSDGKALIIANLILDSQDYYPSDSSSLFSHNGGIGYANNYALSAIRKFLNDTFYNTAFDDLQKALIETTIVDNSVASTGQSSNDYACNNTSDKIFLLSYKEATTYYTSTTARQAKGTDYAKCQGLWVYSSNGNSYWWLRSPDYNYARHAYSYYVDYVGRIYYNYVYYTYYGVRPACWINL